MGIRRMGAHAWEPVNRGLGVGPGSRLSAERISGADCRMGWDPIRLWRSRATLHHHDAQRATRDCVASIAPSIASRRATARRDAVASRARHDTASRDMTVTTDGVTPIGSVLMSPSGRVWKPPSRTTLRDPSRDPPGPGPGRDSRAGNFPPGPGRAGPGRPGRPGRPGGPREAPGRLPGRPPRGGPFRAYSSSFYAQKGIFDPSWRGSPGGAFWGLPGTPRAGVPGRAKKCTFFWVFNNSPSRDSLVPFFGSRDSPGPAGPTPLYGAMSGGMVQSSPDGSAYRVTPDAVCPA